jgi:hypothetical protein
MQAVNNDFTIEVLTTGVPPHKREDFLVNLYPWLNHHARRVVKTHWQSGVLTPAVLRAKFDTINAIVMDELERYTQMGNKISLSYGRHLVAYVMYNEFVKRKQMRLVNLGAHFTPALKHPEVLYSVKRVEWLMFKDKAFGVMAEAIANEVAKLGHVQTANRLHELNFKALHNGIG